MGAAVMAALGVIGPFVEKFLPYILCGVLGVVGGAFTAGKIDAVHLSLVEKHYAAEQAAAIAAAQEQQRTFDNIAVQQAQTETAAQAALTQQAQAQLNEVGNHVSVQTITRACVPYGVIRLLDAAATGRNVNALSLPAGKSDDACSPVAWLALVRSVIANYSTARANAEQLNQLIGTNQAFAKARR